MTSLKTAELKARSETEVTREKVLQKFGTHGFLDNAFISVKISYNTVSFIENIHNGYLKGEWWAALQTISQ